MSAKILVIDDETKIVDILSYNLKREGYETLTAHDGEAGLKLALGENPDLILLDIMMPKMDGYEVCKRVREVSQVPIIMLTARADETDKVLSFDLGADDYVVKPFGMRELLKRVMANLRRSGVESKKEVGKQLVFGELVIDLDLYEVKRGGEVVDLTRREFEVVRFLATQNNQVFSREMLLKEVWGFEFFGDVRTVDVTIRRLRTKLEPSPEVPTYVLTKRGVGYHFTAEYGTGTAQ
ncbi:MAG: response regulator transcription factor [Defluviitaleaceae bacterium]|nr:response regulator transcription factor [Defluviitaleaceae bacterium]MCL2240611.1 response regulator transcription factor [Defluviitaleaceae bacterium]